MVCKKCGQQFEDGFNNCPNCGESVSGKKKAKKPVFKKWWFWLIIVLVLVVLIGSSGGSEETESTTADNSAQTTLQAVEATEENSIQEETTEAADGFIRVGEILEDSGLEITYVSAEKWTGYNQYSAPKSGNMIIKLWFDVTNNASGDRYITLYDFNCYADGAAAEEYFYGDDDISLTLSQGRSGSGAVYFEVPVDAEKIEVEYEVNVWSDEKAIFLVELP